MWPSHDIVELIAPRIPSACVGSAVISHVGELSAQLPDVFSSYYLECRLSAEQEQVDFLACMSMPRDERHRRKMYAASERPPGDTPAWRFAWDVMHRWASPDHDWPSRIPCLWLEFDHMNTRSTAWPSPSIWVGVDPGYPNAHIPSASWDPRNAYEVFLDFIMPAVPPAVEGLLSGHGRRAMAACFQRLPPGGRIIHASLMLAREPVAIKIYGAIPRAHLEGYLKDLAWPGPLELLKQVERTFYTPETADDTVYFDLALHHSLLPYAAIAFSQLQLGEPARSAPGRDALLGLLEEHGLCTAEKREALLTWPGSARESRPSTSVQARIARWFDAKITIHSEQGVGAKGYLGFAPILSLF
ncbi:hypothetical protein [Polyangium sp. y55x31]|uniref:hypothetical protein n=1 Tax=Polyangium sp. y55x31 TaxID=3042688 RepID=UPI00248249D4|nr:hypothetical protein [Polyangium sp. y55x31]MDI1480335.1 hypothetical protein [Polyangium sp. y55x31]